jgi:hypothetical protein
MTPAEYAKLRDATVTGRQARLTRPVANGGGYTLQKGTVVTIKRKFGGFEIEGVLCKHCGVQVRVTRVNYGSLDLLPEAAS